MPATILIAEDNMQLAESLAELLRRRGFDVVHAADGVEAFDRIVKNSPDLLILDLKLPRLHGVELLKKLRQSPSTRALPVIIMSGAYRGEQYARAARSLGVDVYLEKPFRASDLLQAIQQTLASPAHPTATFDHHLRRAFRQRFCGRLLLRGSSGEHSLTFISGTPVFLRPGFAYRDFGHWLHLRGYLSAEEYAWYLGPGQLRHELPVQMGCIGYPDLLEEKLAYLSAELIAAFGCPPFIAEEHTFAPPAGLQLLTVNVPMIFYQGYHQHPSPDTRQRLLAEDGVRYAALASDYYCYGNFLSLTSAEKRFLARLDGTQRLVDCLKGEEDFVPLAQTLRVLGMLALAESPLVSSSPPDFPLRRLFNTVAGADIAPVEAPLESFADLADSVTPDLPSGSAPSSALPPANLELTEQIRNTREQLKGKNHYEVFGMSQGGFSFELLKERYFSYTRRFGPEVLMQTGGVEAAMVEQILDIVATAYNTLSDVVKKENYDQLLGMDRIGLGQHGDDQFQAQVQAQSGKVFIDMSEWDNAERALQDACNIDPGNGDYLAHLAWAIYRNPRSAASHALREKARHLLNRALTLERTPSGFAFKGWMLMESGQDALAESEFGKALKLDAREPMARKGLRALQEKREQEKKGLFRRMFS